MVLFVKEAYQEVGPQMSHQNALEGVGVSVIDTLMHEDTDPQHRIALLCGLIVIVEVIVIGMAGDPHLGVIGVRPGAEVLQDTGAGEAGHGVLYPGAQFATVADATTVAVQFAALLQLQPALRGEDHFLTRQHQGLHKTPSLRNGLLIFRDRSHYPVHHLGVHLQRRAWCLMMMVLPIQGGGRIHIYYLRLMLLTCLRG